MQVIDFLDVLQSQKFDNVFNPYSDFCAKYDQEGAPLIRSQTLLLLLEKAKYLDIDAIWIGRDLGHRGGRRTGLALTDDVHLPVHVKRWDIPYVRPTKGNLNSEVTATVIWDVLQSIDQKIFLWNVFPFHPYEPNNHFSNRAHDTKERKVGEAILDMLISMLAPKKIVAIGNDAAISGSRLITNKNFVKVRHPSFGGKNIFLREMKELYCFSERQNSEKQLSLLD